jgi:phytoene dehydrogenase-like protein
MLDSTNTPPYLPIVNPMIGAAALVFVTAFVAACRELEAHSTRSRETAASSRDAREREKDERIQQMESQLFAHLRESFAGHREQTHLDLARVLRRFLRDRGTEAFGAQSEVLARQEFARWVASLGVSPKTATAYMRILSIARSIVR